MQQQIEDIINDQPGELALLDGIKDGVHYRLDPDCRGFNSNVHALPDPPWPSYGVPTITRPRDEEGEEQVVNSLPEASDRRGLRAEEGEEGTEGPWCLVAHGGHLVLCELRYEFHAGLSDQFLRDQAEGQPRREREREG